MTSEADLRQALQTAYELTRPAGTFYTTDYVYLLRGPHAALWVLHDRHTEGLFPRATWETLLAEVGFAPQANFFEHSEVEPGEIVHFLGHKA